MNLFFSREKKTLGRFGNYYLFSWPPAGRGRHGPGYDDPEHFLFVFSLKASQPTCQLTRTWSESPSGALRSLPEAECFFSRLAQSVFLFPGKKTQFHVIYIIQEMFIRSGGGWGGRRRRSKPNRQKLRKSKRNLDENLMNMIINQLF